MRICILGWYGTETLGDRAILAGLLDIFNATFDIFNINIGSLYPILTQRTLLEDELIYDEMAPNVKIDYFYVKNKSKLDAVLAESDFIVMGGGPIMDVTELEIISYAFRYAKKKSKKTAVLGCGIGPLYKKQFIDSSLEIFSNSDLIVLRDKNSLIRLASLASHKPDNILNKALFAHDPAVLPVGKYLSKTTISKANKIAVNFRKFPSLSFQSNINISDQFLAQLLVQLSKIYDQVNLVPMHTFCVGGDDRYYLSELKMLAKSKNINVVHKPMNLYELLAQYASSEACIGMRYHSVVFQTLLNGNNYIFDYTEKNIGKINSFLEIIDGNGFYNDRYINMQEINSNTANIDMIDAIATSLKQTKCTFIYDDNIYNETLSKYKSEISNLFINETIRDIGTP